MKWVVVVTFFCLTTLKLFAQDAVFNSWITNPYLINPAEATTDYSQLHLNYRKQWLGFNGAPQYNALTYTTRFNKSHAGFGASISGIKNGIISKNDFLLTYAYDVNLNTHQRLTFALSAGADYNSIDLSIVDAQDPALKNFLDQRSKPLANFGMLLHCNSGLNFGVTIPKLLVNNLQNHEYGAEQLVSPFDEIIVNAYYKRMLPRELINKKSRGYKHKKISGERAAPLELYLLYRYVKNLPAQAEAFAKLNLSETVAIGGGYRQWLGPVGLFSLNLSKVIFSYMYEPATQLASFSTSSHEIQLGFKIGKQKQKVIKKTPVLKSTLKTNVQEQHVARFQQTEQNPLEETEEKGVKNYYVTVKSFNDFTAADQLKEKLIAQKFNANVFYHEGTALYYVYVFETTQAGEAQREARNLKNFTKLKGAKVLTVSLVKKH